MRAYEEKLAEYKLRKFSVRVRNCLELIPDLSFSIKTLLLEFECGRFRDTMRGVEVRKEVTHTLKQSVLVLMMQEYEILCWVNYVD
mmetsp:Transcript_37101/g.45272  ORF Transcript_37101/g.45272 Transcript_37101/m.45272 type:complete len:86 (+) Transcript_37101:695-952(+)